VRERSEDTSIGFGWLVGEKKKIATTATTATATVTTLLLPPHSTHHP